MGEVAGHGWHASRPALPAWSLPKDAVDRISLPGDWPEHVTREWAFGGSTGKGARVCILDSGVEAAHPLVGGLESAVVISVDENEEPVADPDTEGDVSGHGTACAGIVRALAPEVAISSVRVLWLRPSKAAAPCCSPGSAGRSSRTSTCVNMSLSTTKKPFASVLHESAYSAALPVLECPSPPRRTRPSPRATRGASRPSSRSGATRSPTRWRSFYNPSPPVEFFGRGVNVEVPWSEGRTLTVSGNSFATPHLTAICALILAKHPELTPFQLKSVLYLTATNVMSARPGIR